MRLHVDKALLRTWRGGLRATDARAWNRRDATPRVARGRNKGKVLDGIYRADLRGKSTVIRERVKDVVTAVFQHGSYRDRARDRLVETRKSIVAGWLGIAETLEHQGEAALAGDVRHFTRPMPRVLTGNEQLALEFGQQTRAKDKTATARPDRIKERTR